MKQLYKPKLDLKEVVIALAGILAQLVPPEQIEEISDLVEEMNKWGKTKREVELAPKGNI